MQSGTCHIPFSLLFLPFTKLSLREKLYHVDVPHVGKYDRADDRPKLAMLAANVGYRYWTDDRSRLG